MFTYPKSLFTFLVVFFLGLIRVNGQPITTSFLKYRIEPGTSGTAIPIFLPTTTFEPLTGFYAPQITPSGKLAYVGNFTSGQYLIQADTNSTLEKVWRGTSARFKGLASYADGSYIVGGTTNAYGAGGDDFFLMRMDSSGSVLWFKTYGTTAREVMQRMTKTQDGGVACLGRWDGNLVMLRVDSLGNKIWMKSMTIAPGSYSNDVGDMIQTEDGGFVFTSQNENPPDRGCKLVKLDVNGNLLWQHQSSLFEDESWPTYTTTQEFTISGVAELPGGNLIVGADHFYYYEGPIGTPAISSIGPALYKARPSGAITSTRIQIPWSAWMLHGWTFTSNGQYIGNGKVVFAVEEHSGTIPGQYFFLLETDTSLSYIKMKSIGSSPPLSGMPMDVGDIGKASDGAFYLTRKAYSSGHFVEKVNLFGPSCTSGFFPVSPDLLAGGGTYSPPHCLR
jgi:hypothetical protein